MKKRIVLCADDYGQAPAISAGIIALIQAKRLFTTSCLVTSPYWPEHAAWLVPLRSRATVGLHFNLTEGQPLSRLYQHTYGRRFSPLQTLMIKAGLRQLNKAAILAECHAQIDCFVENMGYLPQFLDGHQHVHQFPIIREAVAEVYQERLRAEQAYIRWVNDKPKALEVKKWVIYASGTLAFKRLLTKNKIPHNQTFAGIYSFKSSRHYGEYFPQFLESSSDGGLIMCHPALPTVGGRDVMSQARATEYAYFVSEQFLKDCKDHGVVFAPC